MTSLPDPQPRTLNELAFAIADGAPLDPAEYRRLRRALVRVLSDSFAFDMVESFDVADEAITRFVGSSKVRHIRPIGAWPYLRRIAHNVAVDRLRARTPVPSDSEISDLATDDIAAMLSAHASAQTVEQLLAELALAGDTTATRVISVYLHLAETYRRAPTTREVSAQAEVSHVTVSNVMNRCRRTLDQRTR